MKKYLVILAFLSLTGCWGEEWLGLVYPDRSDLTKDIVIGSYSSFEQCQSAAISWLRTYNFQISGDYECGLNCDTSHGKPYLCETTSK